MVKFLMKMFNKKPVSLGIKYEIERFLGFVETIDEKEAKLKALNEEKKIFAKIDKELDQIRKKVVNDEKKYKKKLSAIIRDSSEISSYLKKIDRLISSLNNLKTDIKSRMDELDSLIVSAKNRANDFETMKEKIDKEKKKVKEMISKIDKKIEKESKKKAIGYSAVVVESKEEIKLPKIKKEKPKPKPKKKSTPVPVEKEDIIEEALDDNKVEIIKEEPKAKVETEVDKLLKLVREKKKISFSKLAKIYDEKQSTIEQWVEALEDEGFVEVVYPLIGSPYIKLKEDSDEKQQ